MIVVSVRDTVSSTFGTPFFSQNQQTALRSVRMEVNNADARSVLHTHPADFELYVLGEFDDISGSFTLRETPLCVCRLDSLVVEV